MDDFSNCINNAELEDMRNWAFKFTWSNNSPGDERICRKFDRVLVNDKWGEILPYSVTEFKAPGLSDHTLLLIHIIPKELNLKKLLIYGLSMTSFLNQLWKCGVDICKAMPFFVYVKSSRC